ncbi:MAG: glycosyltransferase family 4 protein [Candidatus Shapirobacteria bacterium]|nr:glycosyltransferase family 4 protein [Candidatus Shapirobacteria bacterium]
MKKPRILIGITYWLPNISGVTQYGVILADELKKRKYEVKVLTAKSSPNPSFEKRRGINIVRIPGFSLGKGFIMPRYCWKSLLMVKEADIVNCHLPSVECFWLALWGKLFGKKVVTTYQCQFNSRNNLISFGVKLIDWLVLGLSEKIVVNSMDYIIGNDLWQQYRQKMIEIYPPVKIVSTKEKFKFKGEKIIGFLGRISSEKNIELLIEAFSFLPKSWTLVIAGPENIIGEEKYQQKIDLLVNMDIRIVKLGKINNPVKFFNSIDCMVLPSNNRLEAFGMASAEAISCGCPVVVSDIPGVRVPVKLTGMGKMFRSNDVKDLANKITAVIKNKPKISNINIFSIKSFMESYEKVF